MTRIGTSSCRRICVVVSLWCGSSTSAVALWRSTTDYPAPLRRTADATTQARTIPPSAGLAWMSRGCWARTVPGTPLALPRSSGETQRGNRYSAHRTTRALGRGWILPEDYHLQTIRLDYPEQLEARLGAKTQPLCSAHLGPHANADI